MRRTPRHATALVVATVLGLAACGGSDAAPDTAPDAASPSATSTSSDEPAVATPADQRYPDVVDAIVRQDGDAWAFDVTLSSPYDTPERYADGWRILAPDGTELGFRLLTHDHASEQPFTRSLDGVEIPDDVDTVTIEGRDQANGFGGETIELTLPR